ncbi:MAG: rod shape-determining protein RodA, partial [Clostridiales bacterium]|nr:rod shape-determining protein RodA [Clostridiales bacterium]
KYFDWPVAILVLALVAIGILMIANATGKPIAEEGSGWLEVITSMNLKPTLLNGLWFVLGIGLVAVVLMFDYEVYGRLSPLIYWANIALLAAVLILGTVRNNAQSWFTLGERAFQPSEIAKLAIIITLAKQLSRYKNGVTTLRELLPVLLHVMIPLVLIMLQPDYGTAMVYVFITAIMLFASGTRLWIMSALTVSGVASMIPLWKYVMSNIQKKRFLTFLNPDLDPWGAGYNVVQSKMAVGSGQITGKGFFNKESLTQLDYIPYSHTDFIFSVTGETLGLIGTLTVVALYTLLIFRLLWLSRQAYDAFGSYIIIGVMAMMMFHIFQNIGMTIGIMPVTGIPLPFISYGGSNMWTNMIAIGLVLGIGMRRRRNMFAIAEGEL